MEQPCQTHEELKTEAQKLRQWFETQLKEKWNPIEYKNPDVSLYELPNDGSKYRTRCRVHCNCTFEQMYNFNKDSSPEELRKYDKSMLIYKVFDHVDDTNIIVTDTSFSVMWPVSPRQFISLHDNYPVENGHIFVQSSIQNNKVALHKKYVLGYKKSGLLIEKDLEDESKCYIERVILMDPRGSIPTFVASSYKTNDAEITQLRAYVEQKVSKGEL
ncbi:START domain-containing protein [Entamoeba marina]